MASIAKVSIDELKGKIFKKIDYSYSDISDAEIMNIKMKSEKYKKKLGKFLSKKEIKYIVSDDICDVANIDGKNLLKSIFLFQ